MKSKIRQDKFMEESTNLKLAKDGSIVVHMPHESKKTFKKVRTRKSDELNYYIPEKWNYN